MARERCLKKSFQDSLEDIKERMKEKRTQKLAKVTSVSKALSSKVKIIANTSITVKSYQANNQALALAVEAEKLKTRQAQDLILHLKREQQRMMFEIFLLRRKLNLQQGSTQSEAKLASLKEIIAKVTHNLLETANLLGPAHALCSSDCSTGAAPAMEGRSGQTSSGLVQTCVPPPDVKNVRSVDSCSSAETRNPKDGSLKTSSSNGPASRGRKSSLNLSRTDDESSDTETTDNYNHFKNVSVRRRASNLDTCVEETSRGNLLLRNSMIEVPESEPIAPVEDNLNKNSTDQWMSQSPSKDDIVPFTKLSQISSSTPEPKPKKVSKGKNELRSGRERAKKGRAEGGGTVQLKKPWEKTKPRARSKSRERGASKSGSSKDTMNSSLNSGDAYDFVFEESIHVTPFRQGRPSKNPDENEESEEKGSTSEEEQESEDDLYLPSREKLRQHSIEKNTASLPLRPRSKRSKVQQSAEKKENRSSDRFKKDIGNSKKNRKISMNGQGENPQTPFNKTTEPEESNKANSLIKCGNKDLEVEHSMDLNMDQDLFFPADKSLSEPEGVLPGQRSSLADLTNYSLCSGRNETKKHSFPFSNDSGRKLSGTSMRKRRCTVTVNYAEPSLTKKLRRGDPFTDTKFLSSPIFKNRKSLTRQSLSKYNEAFVGCRR
ncbi:shugoshin 1 isoform X2 [Rana temporaria]|uniref:shugoshin 1 isoform X2 n=1 Tax=Rana temporaria TaxID=8407 RepID=UPI001AADCAEB|nr:shugoshin 1 isoform X2 [Rana temporaria]